MTLAILRCGLASMEALKVSIIITNYNYGRFLHDAIDSALRQTYEDCEVVVIDDGSTDDSRHVIESYGRLVKAIYKCNGGQGSALNVGFEASAGDLIIFLDADDVLLPRAVETVAARMRQGVALVRYPLEVMNGAGEPSGRYVGGLGSQIPSARLGPFGGDSPGSAKAFSRKVLERIMPIPEEHCGMGADAFLAALTSVLGEVVCLNEPLGRYRIHGKNHFAEVRGGLAELREAVARDFRLYASLWELTHGEIGPCEEWLGRYPQHWVSRIASLREGPTDHGLDDNLLALIQKAIFATWRQPYWNVRRKLAYTCLVVGYSIAPLKIARVLKDVELNRRGHLLNVLLGRNS